MFVKDTVDSQNFDFFSSDGAEEDMKDLLLTLTRMEKRLKDPICSKAIDAAAPILLEEEKRLLERAPNYHNFPNLKTSWLTIRKFKNRHLRWIAQVGYESDIIEKHPETLILEFGRPGHSKIRELKKPDRSKQGSFLTLRRCGRDKKGRKIGVIQPYSHIRAAWFAKKDEIRKCVAKIIFDEIERTWE